jgi:DNA primase
MDAAEEVKQHLDIVDIVGEYLQLKPAGSGSFKACCPFHQEKTPSFYANRQRQSWHCFGCDKGGDMISFVMAMEGMEFRDALELLAQKSGIQLPAFDGKASGQRKRLHEINDLASKFFRAQLLQSPQATHARAYAEKRNIDNLTGDLFRIGYALESWDALTNALLGKGVTEDELVLAGLASRRERGDGVYDRFRNRLMFTIQDVHGNIVGFTGRQLDPNAKEAKYVNTPETPVYKKSMVLYGLDKAKGAIKSKDLCVVVEGNMDVLSSHRVNICHVVASSGTALTAEQLKLIGRFTQNIAIAFDGDSAGIHATLRGLDLARAQDFRIRVIALPPELGKDPDEVIAKDPTLWEQAIQNAVSIMDWIFQSAMRQLNPSDPESKRNVAASVLPEIKRIPDPIVRDHWLKKLAEALQTDEHALRDALTRTKTASQTPQTSPAASSTQKPPAASKSPTEASRLRDIAESLLALILKHPPLLQTCPEHLGDMLPEDLRGLYITLREQYHSDQSHSGSVPESASASPDSQQSSLVNYLTIRADRDYPIQNAQVLEAEFKLHLSTFLRLSYETERRQLEEEMRLAELAHDRVKVMEIAQRFRELHDSSSPTSVGV